MRLLQLLALTTALFAATPVYAGEAASKTREVLESGRLAAGEKDFAARLGAKPGDDETIFGLGLIRLARAIEHYGQAQYRYGLRPPKSVNAPFLRFPVPHNPKPETATYQGQREVLQSLLAELTAVEATLAPMSGKDVKIKLSLGDIKLDLRNDGKADAGGKLSSIVAALGMRPADAGKNDPPFEIAFDTADALWLRGYCHLMSATIEFLLAYDWHQDFEVAGQVFYPRIDPPAFGGVAQSSEIKNTLLFGEERNFADLLALLHNLNWPLVDAPRLQAAHAHLKQVTALSRLTWKAILAETDDDHEWIPGPQQKNGVLAGMPVSQEQVSEWLAALDDFDAVLDGKLLIPYWRFAQGINLRKVFFEPRPFDLVMWFTGHAAAPYAEAGPVMSQEVWRKRQEIFGGNFPGYAVWFN